MIDEREIVRRAAEALTPPEPSLDRLLQRRDRVQRNRRIRAGVLGIAVAIAVGWAGFEAIRSTPPVPADDDRSEELGIFAPVAGRILYVNENDLGYGPGLWAVDPNAPSDTTVGSSVAADVASTLVPLPLDPQGFDAVTALAWSRDGTELLFKRTRDDLFPEEYLYILHADGSETQLNDEPMYLADGATFSPDGQRVVFAAQGDHLGLWTIDADGGRPEPLPVPVHGLPDSPTFSPDGSQLAYLDYADFPAEAPHEYHVWVTTADGSDAHEILVDDQTRFSCGDLQWSPAGDRLLCSESGTERNGDVDSISTFAPDGSGFTRVIDNGTSPYWSPDGTQIAFTKTGGGASLGLAIAEADGSNIRDLGFAASGPWHPSGSIEVDEPTPTPSDSLALANGEVLSFTGSVETPGDLVAVDPETGEERVLAEDLDDVSSARWSADGRWVAFEMSGSLWVVDRTPEPRQVFEAPNEWSWSPTGAQLVVFRGSETLSDHTLYVVDPSTGSETELASIVDDVFSPVWSPDGTSILFGVRGGTVYSVDVRTGERSLFVQLPGKNLDSIDAIEWSPDGSRLAFVHNGLDLYVVNQDGSGLRALAQTGALVFGFDWSPDGSQIVWTQDHGGELQVLMAPPDGSTPTLVASLPNAPTNPVWSPDGSQIALGHRNAFLSEGAPNLVIDADGSGDAVPLDDLTYESWRGGSYDCDCDFFG